MPQSLIQLFVHIVFSTKNRRPFLSDQEFRDRTHRFMAGHCKKLKCPAVLIGGVADHIHILCLLGRTISISEIIRDLKRDSCKWIKDNKPELATFQWQQGYGAFSLSPAHVAPLKTYIADQENHHKAESYEDEFRRFCQNYGVKIDERYVWD